MADDTIKNRFTVLGFPNLQVGVLLGRCDVVAFRINQIKLRWRPFDLAAENKRCTGIKPFCVGATQLLVLGSLHGTDLAYVVRYFRNIARFRDVHFVVVG